MMWTNPNDNEELPELPNGAPEATPLVEMTDGLPTRKTNRPERFLKDTPGKVEAAYADHLAQGKITKDELGTILWLVHHGKTEKDNRESLAKKIGVSYTTIKQVFDGTYDAKLTSVVARIEEYQRLVLARQSIAGGAFVETSLVKKIWLICDTARAYNTIIPIYGDSQTGKSLALVEYTARHNHGRTIYMRCPTMGSFTRFLQELNGALGENKLANPTALYNKPFGLIDSDKLLIIDEVTQAFLRPGKKGAIKLHVIEYLRELHDKTKCGLVICGTNGVRYEFEKGDYKGVLEQTRRRSMTVLQLPAMLPRKDLDLIAASFGLPPAPKAAHELRVEIISKNGLAAYNNYLRGAGPISAKLKQELSWSHFESAHDVLAQLSLNDDEEDAA